MMLKVLVFILLLSVVLLFFLFFLLIKKKPKILVVPWKSLIDESVKITILNLAAHEHVTLEASRKDKNDNIWLSRATFEANSKGMVDVATQSPVFGSYKGIDPMGLFWSMTPTDKNVPVFSSDKDEVEVLLSVISQNKLRAQKTIYRLLISPNIEKRPIREQGVVGTLLYPKNMTKGPGIIIVSGSNGGIPEKNSQAGLLASHGYAVLALGYFAAEGLPEKLENIPLEYFQNAMRWFKKQPQVDEERIALSGMSRGGELVLLLAATFPKEMNAAIAYVPSSLVYGGVPQENNPAWTYKNSPIPFMPSLSDEEMSNAVKEGKIPFHKGTFEDPYEMTTNFLYGMKKFQQPMQAAAIPVENIRCPILILSGEDDKVWPSTLYGKLIMERLNKKVSTIERKHVHFTSAGHAWVFPYGPSISQPRFHPIGKIWLAFGGTAEGNARASSQSWQEALNFLKKNLQ